jgi:hypothetical protein
MDGPKYSAKGFVLITDHSTFGVDDQVLPKRFIA